MTGRDELLARLLEDDLPEAEAAELDRALAADPGLRREAAALAGLDRLLRFRSYIESDRPDIAVGVMCRIKLENLDDARWFAAEAGRRCAGPAAPAFRPAGRGASRRAGRRSSRRAGARSALRGSARPLRAGGRRRTSGWIPALTAAAAVLLVGAWLGYRLTRKPAGDPPPQKSWTARAGTVSGKVALIRSGARSALSGGMRLMPGDRLETAGPARAAFSYDDGSAVEMNGNTALALGTAPAARHLAVERGDAYLHAAPQPAGRPMLLNPGRHDQVEVAGTELAVSVFPHEVTVVQVVAGRVLFGSGQFRTEVGAGFASRALPGRDPERPEPLQSEEVAPWRRPGSGPDQPPGEPRTPESPLQHSLAPPVAAPAAEPLGGRAPLAVRFDASDSWTRDGKVVEWRWDFGDGSTGSGRQTQHVFRRPGRYVVRLTVRDERGQTAVGELSIEAQSSPGTGEDAR